MMTQKDKLKIVKQLQMSSELEMMRHDIEELLEEELAKPDSEIDTELVDELLQILEPSAVISQKDMEYSWERLKQRIQVKQRRANNEWKRISHVAAAIVIVLILAVGAMGTAEAFNWEILFRWIQPFSETFRINNRSETSGTLQSDGVAYTDAEVQNVTSVQYSSLEEFPTMHSGYMCKPSWMPERFTYVQGTLYEDVQMTKTSIIYVGDSGVCAITMNLYRDTEGKVLDVEYEKVIEASSSNYVSGYPVTFYLNADNAMLSASWVVDAAHYCITGAITEEEAIKIIEKLIE